VQLTTLTFSSAGSSSTESGCVGGGIGGTTVTGASACPAGFTGGDEQAINNVYTAAAIGIADFTQLQLIFNASEPGGVSTRGITIENLALTLWDPTSGLILGAFYLPSPYVIADAFPGVGNAGHGFVLDATQAGAANLLLAAFPELRIGVAATASSATGGQETIFVRSVEGGGPPSEIPEPGTWALVVSALGGLAGLRKFRA
jgi:hypothetical protein